MRVIKPSSEIEMIALFLRHELLSQRFGPAIQDILVKQSVDPLVLTDPNLSSPVENDLRRQTIALHRGYGLANDQYLSDFPTSGVDWQRVTLMREELLNVHYINWDYWLELSGGTRLPTDAARRIREGVCPYGVSHDGPRAVAEGVRNGVRYPELILVTSGEPGANLVVVEGHIRLTGYALALDELPSETEVILGTSVAVKNWSCY